MRIRSPALYRHIRNKKILPLPAMGTINRKLRNLRASYGFQEILFEAMRIKATEMKPMEKRGTYNSSTKLNMTKI